MDRICSFNEAGLSPAEDEVGEPEPMLLAALPVGRAAVIASLLSTPGTREVAQRLERLGFRVGRHIRVIATGPLGRSPHAVEVGGRIFALRAHEAGLVRVHA